MHILYIQFAYHDMLFTSHAGIYFTCLSMLTCLYLDHYAFHMLVLNSHTGNLTHMLVFSTLLLKCVHTDISYYNDDTMYNYLCTRLLLESES